MTIWKTFAIDTNAAFGLVDSAEKWQAMVHSTAELPNFHDDKDAARRHLLSTRLLPESDPPSFGFYPRNTGQTLAEFFLQLMGSSCLLEIERKHNGRISYQP